MDYIESIEQSLKKNVSHQEIVRKIYLTYPTFALIDKEEKQFEILNEVSLFFDIPINHVQVCGSAKVGRSFHKVSDFTPENSDLDIAIIDSNLFFKYTELVFNLTNGLRDKTKFKTVNGFKAYSDYITRGIFRPDLMPTSQHRAEWFNLFHKLSLKHKKNFKSINAGIYQSQLYFEFKQIDNIKEYIISKKI